MPAVLTLAMLGIPLKKWNMYRQDSRGGLHPGALPDIEQASHRDAPPDEGWTWWTECTEIRGESSPRHR